MEGEIKTIFMSSVLVLGVLFSVITPTMDASAKTVQRASYPENMSSSITSQKNRNSFDINNIKKTANSVDQEKLRNASDSK